MKTLTKSTHINATPAVVFNQMDDFSKTGMHMTENSAMMMGSKLSLEQLSKEAVGMGAKFRWFGKMIGMKIDFTQIVSRWEPSSWKEWETIGVADIIIMSWYRMWFQLSPDESGTIVKVSISYQPPVQWYYKILSFFFAGWYCNWCLNNMLQDTKNILEGKELKRKRFMGFSFH